ncbi:MAG: alanine racemase [Solirubrobacterales bacterium]|nr:alanine racemase [Solirubrobacterales bacterium]
MERAIARIDLGAVEANCRALAARLEGGAALCAVVKADAYGHGLAGCVAAALAGGAGWLAVATAAEAAQLRAVAAGFPQPEAFRLLTMGALSAAELDTALEARSEIAVWRPGFARLVAERAAERGIPVRVHVKHDSGMGRLGEPDADAVVELAAFCATDPNLELAGVWTHFATADEPDDDYFPEQLQRFTALAERIRAEHPGCLLHAANSAAVLREPASHFDIVRCGIAVYGLDPFHRDPRPHGLEPALSLHSYVADVKRFPAGASAGYGRSWTAAVGTWVGVLPIGYGDGVRRGLGNNADVLVDGRRYPLVGTVSMDNVTVDLGPETSVEPGAAAVLIGAQGEEEILAEEVARRLETINYEVTCGISARVPRVAG